MYIQSDRNFPVLLENPSEKEFFLLKLFIPKVLGVKKNCVENFLNNNIHGSKECF